MNTREHIMMFFFGGVLLFSIGCLIMQPVAQPMQLITQEKTST